MIFGNDLTKDIQQLFVDSDGRFRMNFPAENGHFAVTDKTVFSLYRGLFDADKTFIMQPGETQKNLDTVSEICRFLLSKNANREATLVAVGGGVVGDITGFAASIYMRGIDWMNVPTTLLAQCDSSVGGKTGVDLDAVKNIIGSFHFPKEVFISSHFLKTLNKREFLCGMGEVLKTACLSTDLFLFYKNNAKKMLQRDESLLRQAVEKCARYKDEITTADPYEVKGLRKILNVGHTVGHAFETADHYARSHGEYVLWGMLAEARMCKDLVRPQFEQEHRDLIAAVLGDTRFPSFDIEKAVMAACNDKKNKSHGISVVAVLSPGETKEVFFTKKEFEEKLKKAMERL